MARIPSCATVGYACLSAKVESPKIAQGEALAGVSRLAVACGTGVNVAVGLGFLQMALATRSAISLEGLPTWPCVCVCVSELEVVS